MRPTTPRPAASTIRGRDWRDTGGSAPERAQASGIKNDRHDRGGTMRGRALLFTSFLLLSTAAHAQIWQPAAAPPVTAENTAWFQSGEPIYWMGDVYYPAGATRMFDSYIMVR